MRQYAFLRAINTGARRLTNEELLAPFRSLGLHDVAAYQAAGNVTFTSGADGGGIDEQRLDDELRRAYGFEATTFLRRGDELAHLVASCPFDERALADTAGKVQVTFLRRAPTPASVAAVHALVPPEDRVVVAGAEWWWLPPEGVGASQLDVAGIERILGPMTVRTLGTVERMLAKFGT